MEFDLECGNSVNSVSLSGDRTRIVASTSSSPTLSVWNAATGQKSWTIDHKPGSIGSVSFSDDGTRIVGAASSSTSGSAVVVWDAATGKEIATLEGQAGNATCAAFSRDGKFVVSGGADGNVRLWDVSSRKGTLVLRGHTTGIQSVAFSPDGKSVVSGSTDGTVKIWDATTPQNPIVLSGHLGTPRLALSDDGKHVASSGWTDFNVMVWDAATGRRTFNSNAGEGENRHYSVTCVSISGDGGRVVSSSIDELVKLWDTKTGDLLHVFKGHKSWIHSVANSLAISVDGKRIASGGMDKTVRLWDADTGREVARFDDQSHEVQAVAFSRDGKLLASGDQSQTMIRDIATGRILHTLKGPGVFALAFSRDGKRLAGGGVGAGIWDVTTGQELCHFNGHTSNVRCVSFSGDGKRVVTATYGGSNTRGELKVWDAATGHETMTLRDCWGGAAFSQDNKRIVCNGIDGTLKILDASRSMRD